jgi:hypothetical protein
MWLLRKIRPDFKTIADFRKTNRTGITKVCREFTVLCQRLGLFGGELVAIDGSKVHAVNSKNRNFSEAKLKRLLEEIEAKIEAYLKQLDRQDAEDATVPTPTAEELRERLRRAHERKQAYEGYVEQLKQSGETQVSLTDPDSRKMPTGQGSQVGYNVLIAVDEKHKLIVAHDVTNAVTDRDQLASMGGHGQGGRRCGDADRGGGHGLLPWRRGEEMRGAVDRRVRRQTQHVGEYQAGVVRERVLPVRRDGGCLPLPGR